MQDQITQDTIWLNVGQAMARGGVCRQWLYERLWSGDLKSKREGYGSLRYFDQDSLDTCLQAQARWLARYRKGQESALAGNPSTTPKF